LTQARIRLTPLGSLGWMPARSRHTCCYCLEYKNRLIILDAGTGIARFEEEWGDATLKRYNKVIILLSHYHMDHVVGLTYLPRFFQDKQVHIAGPGRSIYGTSAMEILEELVASPFFGRALGSFPMNLQIHDMGRGTTSIDGLTIETVFQDHSDPSVGIKIDGEICYITDTACSAGTVDFIRGCRMVMHDSWYDTHDYVTLMRESKYDDRIRNLLKAHSHTNQVAEAAARANIEMLILIHLNPEYDEHRLSAMEHTAQVTFRHARLAEENYTFAINK